MKIRDRDINIISKIIEYINEINETVGYFGDDFELFSSNNIYFNAVSMCVLQIGELSGLLSKEFRKSYSEIPWRNIKGMRNIMAHKYGTIDKELLWETIKLEIPKLYKFCTGVVEER